MTNIALEFGLATGGGLYGLRPPPLISGQFILPDGFNQTTGNFALTAARYYYAKIYIENIETFSGVKFADQGTGNNGKKVKAAILTMNPATGALAGVGANFGEVTLDGTAGIETLAASFTPTYVGWHILAMTSDSNPSIWSMSKTTFLTTVGGFATFMHGKLGVFPADYLGSVGGSTPGTPVGDYVGGTYANFPESSPLAPTNSIISSSGSFPMFGLYK